jgi:hypothetical protein
VKSLTPVASAIVGLALAASAVQVRADDGTSFTEGFNVVGSIPAGWITTNLSTSPGSLWSNGSAILDASNNPVVTPFEGAGMAIVNFTSISTGTGTINNWFISPLITQIRNGDVFSFYTTTVPQSSYPDRLELRLSTSGSSTDVGATTTSVGVFTTTLASVNPSLALGGYPETWTKITATVSGLASPADGRVAFRYFVTSAGPTGANSSIIGVDSFSYVAAAVPEASTWMLMSAGLAGLIGIAGVRRKVASAT